MTPPGAPTEPAPNPQSPVQRAPTRRAIALLLAVCGIALFAKPAYDLLTPVRPSAIAWRTDLPAAFAESKRTGKPVLIDFTASWCPPCKEMERSTWNDVAVERSADSFIAVKLDVDAEASRPFALRYVIDSIPTILVTDADGKILRRAQFMDARGMVAFLDAKRESR